MLMLVSDDTARLRKVRGRYCFSLVTPKSDQHTSDLGVNYLKNGGITSVVCSI